MSINYDNYEAVIGLEVHTQLLTKSKAYSSDSTQYGATPNSNVSVISMGHPGTLPRINKRMIENAVRLGVAVKANVNYFNGYARKNYFYTDLPKGYQITQDTTPVCNGGFITIKTKSGEEKNIGLIRIHMEEDSGKSIHDQDPFNTLIDLNRAGVPLLEIVSKPDIRNADEAYAYLAEIRRIVRYLEISDGNMEEGSLRCDANISVKPKGSKKYGTRTEVKNMNSLSNVKRAIDYEIKRQIERIENGEKVTQETRSYDAVKDITFAMRTKEEANDYRYFPEPDLPPVLITDEYIEKIRSLLPPLPNELYKKYVNELKLTDYDASNLTEDKSIALYFDELIKHTQHYKAAANWMMGAIKSYLNDNAVAIEQFPIPPEKIAEVIALVQENMVSNSVAEQQIFPEMIKAPEQSPEDIAQTHNLIQVGDENEIAGYVEQAIAKYPEKVKEYRAGKKGLAGMFMGEVMKLSKGKVDPKKANKLVKKYLDDA